MLKNILAQKMQMYSYKEKSYIAKSNIHGKGLFAKKDIKKGEFIIEYLGYPTKRNSKFTLWIDDLGLRVRNNAKYINHSKKPNCDLTGNKCSAIKNIKKDEELVFDYGEDWD